MRHLDKSDQARLKKKYKKAAKALEQAIYHCRKKGFDEPHYYGAIALFRLGYKSKAIARLEEGRKFFPKGENIKKMNEMKYIKDHF